MSNTSLLVADFKWTESSIVLLGVVFFSSETFSTCENASKISHRTVKDALFIWNTIRFSIDSHRTV